jgi:hypothetical protein
MDKSDAAYRLFNARNADSMAAFAVFLQLYAFVHGKYRRFLFVLTSDQMWILFFAAPL